jgi:hypothetical protein
MRLPLRKPIPDQREAEQRMKANDVPAPRLCQCDHPHLEYDEDGFLWCYHCARYRR